MGLLDLLTADYAARQDRTRRLREGMEGLLGYYLGPTGIPDRLSSANALLNLTGQIGEAGANTVIAFDPTRSRQDRIAAALSAGLGTITAAAPAVAGRLASQPVRQTLMETIAGASGPTDDSAARLIADEAGDVPIGRQGSAPPRAPSQTMNAYENYIEDVPIDFLEGIRGNKLRHDTADLEASIAREGIREPLIIMVGKDSRTAVLGEGNHRLQALRSLGYDSAPVRVIVGREWGSDNGVAFDDLIPKSGEYFPADAKPSEVFGRFAGIRQAMDTEQPVRPQNRPSGLLSPMEQ